MSFNVGDVTEAKRLLELSNEPDQETFNRLAQSPSFEVRALLYDKVENIPLPLAHLDEPQVDSFCIDFLLSSFRNHSRSTDDYLGNEYSRAEAAWALAAWFKTFLTEGKEHQLLKMRDEIAEFWRNGDANMREVILTHILEHILDIEGLRALFEPWSADPQLAPAYFEGVEYAKDFSGKHSAS
jgi:hypothetical protein